MSCQAHKAELKCSVAAVSQFPVLLFLALELAVLRSSDLSVYRSIPAPTEVSSLLVGPVTTLVFRWEP